jgi:cell division protein FtsB
VETGGVAGSERKSGAGRQAARRRNPQRRRRLRLVWLVAVAVVTVYLYYRPLSSYFDTRARLASERTEVASLRATKTRLEQRLTVSTSLEATRRAARRLGYVRPGERLFIVKGIPEWRKARRSLRRHG